MNKLLSYNIEQSWGGEASIIFIFFSSITKDYPNVGIYLYFNKLNLFV